MPIVDPIAPAIAVPARPSSPEPLVIDCDACVCQHTDVCRDCLVTFVCDREPNEGVVVDVAEFRALRALGDAGLVPHLRHVRRTG